MTITRFVLRGLLLAAAVLLPAGLRAEDAQPTAQAKVQTRDVELEALVLSVPETWEQQRPSNNLRLGQFEIPAVEGDDEPVELTVFTFAGGGNVRQNVERWIGQFQPQERKAKVTAGKGKQGEYVLLDVSGTYLKPVGPPIQRRTEPMPDARMLAVILEVKDKGIYYLKMAGPRKTVTENVAALRASFGAEAGEEKELELVADDQ